MSEETALLESISPKDIAKCIEPNSSAKFPVENISSDIFNIFNYLLLCPLEWIGRAKAKEFAKRAILADVALWYSNKTLKPPGGSHGKTNQSAKLKICSTRLAPESGSGTLVGFWSSRIEKTMETDDSQYTEPAVLQYLLRSRSVPTESGQSTSLQAHIGLLGIVYR